MIVDLAIEPWLYLHFLRNKTSPWLGKSSRFRKPTPVSSHMDPSFHKKWCFLVSRIITWTLNAERIRKSKGFDVFNRWLGEQHELNMFSVYKSGNWFLILGSKKNSISRLSGNYRTPFPDINSHKPQLLDLGFWIRHVSWLLPSSGFNRVHFTSIADYNIHTVRLIGGLPESNGLELY